VVFLATMVAGVVGIAAAVGDYVVEGLRHPFIVDKGALPHRQLWLVGLGVHVVAALVAFPGCLLLLSRRLLRAAPGAHRWIGRVVGAVVLLALVPTGLGLALTARGGTAGTAGFVVTGLITFAAMVQAIVTARRRDIVGHRRAIAQVVAQLSVAVTSRALLVGVGLVADTDTAVGAALVALDPDLVYDLALWIPVVGSAVVAAIVVPRSAQGPLHQGDRREDLVLDRWPVALVGR
jgi:hypothetical protein